LTPLGEPLSTIAVAKLSGAPHHATFFYLLHLLGGFTVATLIVWAIAAMYFVRPARDDTERTLTATAHKENIREVLVRSLKVYLFVMALIFLGGGFRPLIDAYFTRIPP